MRLSLGAVTDDPDDDPLPSADAEQLSELVTNASRRRCV